MLKLIYCNEPIGKQDYATACGGLNVIEFHASGAVNSRAG